MPNMPRQNRIRVRVLPHLRPTYGTSLCLEMEGCCCLGGGYLPLSITHGSHPIPDVAGRVCLPGAMVITRMPMGARSRAMGSVMPTMPPLEAEYAACPTWRRSGGHRWEGLDKSLKRHKPCPCLHTWPSKAATLAVLMMTPRWPPWSGSFWPISPATRRITLKVPRRFTWKTSRDMVRTR